MRRTFLTIPPAQQPQSGALHGLMWSPSHGVQTLLTKNQVNNLYENSQCWLAGMIRLNGALLSVKLASSWFHDLWTLQRALVQEAGNHEKWANTRDSGYWPSLCHYIGWCQVPGGQPWSPAHRMTKLGELRSAQWVPPLQLSLNFTTINWGLRGSGAARPVGMSVGLIITLLTNLDLIISWEWGWHFQRLLEIRLSPDHENWIPILVFFLCCPTHIWIWGQK